MACENCEIKLLRNVSCGHCGIVLCKRCSASAFHPCHVQDLTFNKVIKSNDSIPVRNDYLNDQQPYLANIPMPSIFNNNVQGSLISSANYLVNSSRKIIDLQAKIDLLQQGLNICAIDSAATEIIMAEYNKVMAANGIPPDKNGAEPSNGITIKRNITIPAQSP